MQCADECKKFDLLSKDSYSKLVNQICNGSWVYNGISPSPTVPKLGGFAFSNNVFCFGICISASRGTQSQSFVIGLSENPHLKAPRISTRNKVSF